MSLSKSSLSSLYSHKPISTPLGTYTPHDSHSSDLHASLKPPHQTNTFLQSIKEIENVNQRRRQQELLFNLERMSALMRHDILRNAMEYADEEYETDSPPEFVLQRYLGQQRTREAQKRRSETPELHRRESVISSHSYIQQQQQDALRRVSMQLEKERSRPSSATLPSSSKKRKSTSHTQHMKRRMSNSGHQQSSTTIWERDQIRKQVHDIKKARLQKVLDEERFTHQPSFNQKSLDMARSYSHPERLFYYDRKKEQSLENAAKEADFTFRPQINEKSRSMPKRSLEDIMQDYHQAQLKKEALRQNIEEQELKDCTFKPSIIVSKHYGRRHGKLKEVLKDPHRYKEYIEDIEKKRLEKRRQMHEEMLAEESRELRFTPEVHDCPEWISTIAESVKIMKAQMPQNPTENPRPRWVN